MCVGGDLWSPGGAACVEDEEGILRVTPLGLTLLRGSGHQGVPAHVHLGVPWHLKRERDRGRKKERRGSRERGDGDNPIEKSDRKKR